MRCYILGAGASRHAGYPLASEVGPKLAVWIERNKATSHVFRNHIEQLYKLGVNLDDFERLITDLDSPPPGSPFSSMKQYVLSGLRFDLQSAICEFFDEIRQNEAKCYHQLAKDHVRKGDHVITFNYDVSFDRELKLAGKWEIGDGYGFDIAEHLTPSSQVKLLKLHGSTNWLASLFGGSIGFGTARDSLGSRPVITPIEFQFLGYENLKDPRYRSGGAIPALIMPGLQKTFYFETTFGREWESFWDAMWAQAKAALERSNEVVVIGYSLPPADVRARELILDHSNREASVDVCCGAGSERIAEEFQEHGFTTVRPLANVRFEDWLELYH